MTLPEAMRDEVRRHLWKIAEAIGWAHLSPGAKAKYYEQWTQDPEVGELLARYMDKGKVRVYLKDTILKEYTRQTTADHTRPFRALGVEPRTAIAEHHVKPHGLLLRDGRVIAWGRADNWKLVLMAVYERAWVRSGSVPFGAVLLNAAGRFDEAAVQAMVEAAAKGLGIKRLAWLRT